MSENLLDEQHGHKNREDYWAKWVQENDQEVVAIKLAELEHNSEHDGLTGLLNRRGLEQGIAYAAALVKREHSTLSLLFMDMDGLKKINDEQGHEKRDEAIRQVAKVVGGLRGIDLEGAAVLIGKIKGELAGAMTTISIGVGVWDGEKDLLEIINEADISMNLLKHSGLANGERSKGIDVVTLE